VSLRSRQDQLGALEAGDPVSHALDFDPLADAIVCALEDATPEEIEQFGGPQVRSHSPAELFIGEVGQGVVYGGQSTVAAGLEVLLSRRDQPRDPPPLGVGLFVEEIHAVVFAFEDRCGLLEFAFGDEGLGALLVLVEVFFYANLALLDELGLLGEGLPGSQVGREFGQFGQGLGEAALDQQFVGLLLLPSEVLGNSLVESLDHPAQLRPGSRRDLLVAVDDDVLESFDLALVVVWMGEDEVTDLGEGDLNGSALGRLLAGCVVGRGLGWVVRREASATITTTIATPATATAAARGPMEPLFLRRATARLAGRPVPWAKARLSAARNSATEPKRSEGSGARALRTTRSTALESPGTRWLAGLKVPTGSLPVSIW